jgi:hypothetical protein
LEVFESLPVGECLSAVLIGILQFREADLGPAEEGGVQDGEEGAGRDVSPGHSNPDGDPVGQHDVIDRLPDSLDGQMAPDRFGHLRPERTEGGCPVGRSFDPDAIRFRDPAFRKVVFRDPDRPFAFLVGHDKDILRPPPAAGGRGQEEKESGHDKACRSQSSGASFHRYPPWEFFAHKRKEFRIPW